MACPCSAGSDNPEGYDIMKPTKLVGVGKDGYPIYVDNMTASASQVTHPYGFAKDGSPIFLVTSGGESETNPINVLGTVAFVGAGAALGWLVVGTAFEYLKK